MLREYDFRSATPNPAGDHIRVAADLSDLFEVITWCKANDAACERIASNAGALYSSVVALDGQLDYLQLLVNEISSRFYSSASVTGESLVSDVPTTIPLAPSLCAPPYGDDWFGAANESYASVAIKGEPPMCIPARRTAQCPCPRCTAKSASAASTALDSSAQSSAVTFSSGVSAVQPSLFQAGLCSTSSTPFVATGTSSTGKRHRPSDIPSAAVSTRPQVPVPSFVATDALRQLAKERAARVPVGATVSAATTAEVARTKRP